MNNKARRKEKPQVRCAIYTRKSTDEGLDREFNTLDAQRESAEAYIASQRREGWLCLRQRYDDGGYTGGNMQRPALKRLLADIETGQVDCVIVYKVDRLSRSLLDFARIIDSFEQYNVSFVSVTQQFNTAQSMGRLTLNILFSFAQFEREIISERTRDKMGAARRKGKRLRGTPVLGYDVHPATRRLVINHEEAARVRDIFRLYLELGGLVPTLQALARRGWVNKRWTTKKGAVWGGRPLVKSSLHYLLTNVTYLGRVRYQGQVYPGEQQAIISQGVFQGVQMLLEQSRRVRRLEKANRCPGLLEGLLYCTACDAPMSHTYTSKGRCRYRYYTCSAAQIRGRDDCPAKSIPATELEQFVLGELKAACGNQTNGQLPWDSLTAAGQAQALARLVERVGYDARDGDLYIRLLPAAGQNQS